MSDHRGSFSFDKIISRRLRTYLGSNKCTIEYEERLNNSLNRYNGYKTPGLYAIVIPSGGGKSTLAKEWGFIDVDDVIGDGAAMERLILERRELIRWGRDRWEEHNEKWFSMVRNLLRKYDFNTKPNIILVHTEEMAFEIGAEVLGALVPHQCMEHERLRFRNTLERMLAIDNLHVVVHRTKTVPVDTYSNWYQLGQFVSMFTWDLMEVAAPFRSFGRRPAYGWPMGYSDDVPFWVMAGDLPDDEDGIRVVQKLFSEGAIPGVCYNYFIEKMYGIRDSEASSPWDVRKWIDLCCDISRCGSMKHISDIEILNNDLNIIYPYESKMASNRRTVGLRRLLENVEYNKNDIMLDVLRNRGGSNQNLVVSIITWIGGILHTLRPEIQERVIRSGILLVPDDSWISINKMCHDLVRVTGEYFGVKLSQGEQQRLMYMHMLYGRFTYDVEEEKEIEKRKRELDQTKMAYVDGNWSTEEYDILELAGIRDAYKRLCDKVPAYKVTDFIEFWKHRRNWAAKGSTVIYEGEKKYTIELIDDIVSKIDLRHNKKSLFEDEKECVNILAGILDDIGRNDSKIVPKYESAAQRALLPGNLYHYVVFSYVLWTFENCASVGDVRLGNNRDESFHAFDDKLFTGYTRFVYDFSDFNAQHSRKSMARVISVLSECTDPVDTLHFCLKWLSLSFGRMELISSGGEKHKVKSGLYSGWRGTTWINSVLNHAYMYVARECYRRLVGTDPFIEYEGAGDDVDGMVKDIAVAGRLYNITVHMGLESNHIKQLFGKRAEFLRVTYDKGYAGASVCRGIGNFISGNWEGEGGSISEKITSAIENILTLGRRGLAEVMVRILYRCVLCHFGRFFQDNEWTGISSCILHGRYEDGGFGIPDEHGCIWELSEKAPAPEGWQNYLKLPARSASTDWAEVIENEAKERGFSVHNKDVLIETLARDSYDIDMVAERFGAGITPEVWSKYWTYKCEVKNKICVETDDVDEGLLMEFLEWLSEEQTPMLDKLEKLTRIGQYVQFLKGSDGHKIDPEDWYGELFDAYNRVTAFNSRRWRVVRCPPVVQSKAARWCKEMLCDGMVTPLTAKMMYMIVCNTYGKVFKMEL